MASVSQDPSGSQRIQFTGLDGKRKTLRLGPITKRAAERICDHVEEMLAHKRSGQPLGREASAWLSGIDSDLSEKLGKFGLIAIEKTSTLEGYIDQYIESRTTISDATRRAFLQIRADLIGYFGPGRLIETINTGEADRFAESLRARLAFNTARRRVGLCKQLWNAAVKLGKVTKNVFEGMSSAVVANTERQRYITPETTAKLFEACREPDFALAIALARWGGLRPSEIAELTWADILWDGSRMNVPQPKTEWATNRPYRVCPIFPELMPYLRDAFERAEPGTVHVIASANIRLYKGLQTKLTRLFKAAGVEAVPKPWNNLRSTRATELIRRFPAHVVTKWLGHSEAIAQAFYWQTTESDFVKAAHEPTQHPTQFAAPSKDLEEPAIEADTENPLDSLA